MTPRQLRAVIHSRRPLHEGFLRVYQYEFDVEKHGGGIERISREMMERGNAVAIDRVYSGEINDLKTLVAGYWFAKHRA